MQVTKRDGRVEEYDVEKISKAISKAIIATDVYLMDKSVWICSLVDHQLQQINTGVNPLDVDQIHDEVERQLMKWDTNVAKVYILYRARHQSLPIPDPNMIGDYIHPAKYARYEYAIDRLETYSETVSRVTSMHVKKFPDYGEAIIKVFDDVHTKHCLPSMRSMQFAGAAIEQNNERMYNCSFTHINRPEVFEHALYLLLCGCGVGYSVQKQHVDKLPELKTINRRSVVHWTVKDCIEGWGEALRVLIFSYAYPELSGYVEFDYSDIRPEGSPLKTSGGVAPGHLPMKAMLENVRRVLDGAQGRKLRPIECHDIMCYIAECVLAGGIRRSSLIALFSKDDDEMLFCKTYMTEFQQGKINAQRALANISVVLRRNCDKQDFLRVMKVNRWSHGEPGFFFCEDEDWGCNPCGEIMLYPKLRVDLIGGQTPARECEQTGFAFCNLTEINAAKCKTKAEFLKAAESAAAIGTLQATYTNFPYLGKVSEEIAKRDALIGVSITGIQDNPKCIEWMVEAKSRVIEINGQWAAKLGINKAIRTTCVKPSGTASLELGCVASGIHYHHAERYFRRIIANPNEAVARYFRSVNPHMVEEMPNGDWCITFPVCAPRGAPTMKDYLPCVFLGQIFDVYDLWIDGHNISSTVVFEDKDWDNILDAVWSNRTRIAAMTFLPATSDKQIPFMPREAVETEADEVRWKNLVDKHKVVDYTKMKGGEGVSFEKGCDSEGCETL